MIFPGVSPHDFTGGKRVVADVESDVAGNFAQPPEQRVLIEELGVRLESQQFECGHREEQIIAQIVAQAVFCGKVPCDRFELWSNALGERIERRMPSSGNGAGDRFHFGMLLPPQQSERPHAPQFCRRDRFYRRPQKRRVIQIDRGEQAEAFVDYLYETARAAKTRR